jgi:hypothetical protein
MNATNIKNLVLTLTLALSAPAMLAAGCSPDSDPVEPTGPAGTEGEGAGDGIPEGQGICLMNNCGSDDECGGCDDNRTTCMVAENRCVACDPNTGEGCQDGYTCSSYGICAPDGQTCNTDERGDPTFDCAKDDDCLACSPMNQVCDPTTKRCSACTGGDTTHCLASDTCVEGKCASKCPADCTTDNDCGQCGSPGNEAHACNAHQCSECSDTFPCAAGLDCVNGSCIPQCGIPGDSAGDCLSNEDCEFCGDPNSTDKFECKKPINSNGPNDHGTCGPAAAGCSDLGSNVAVLPEPWNSATNLCSQDGDCAGQGISLNVGQMVRDLVGSDKINLGFTKIAIQDASVTYGMNKCADIDITENISCGVCVPCEVDTDCAPIGIDPLISQMFAGETLAQIAGSLLLDLLFGSNTEHNLNFYCQPVAAGYGVCAPCSNPMQACGQNQGGGQGSGTCNHSTCETGGALNSSCDTCAANVCANDPYCCTTAWDQTCVDEVAQYCGATTCSGNGPSNCVHSECSSGDKLNASCSTCATAVCNADPYCCDTQWDSQCVNEVAQYCGQNTCQGGNNNNNSCVHSECTTGGKLTSTCSPCATDVCAQDSYCCDNQWDSLCVQIAEGKNSCSC